MDYFTQSDTQNYFTQSGTQSDTFASVIRVFKKRTPKILEQLPLEYNPEQFPINLEVTSLNS